MLMTKSTVKRPLQSKGFNAKLEMKRAKRNVNLLFFAGISLLAFALLYFPVIVPFVQQTYGKLNTGLAVDSVISARQANEASYDAARNARILKFVEAGVVLSENPNYSRKSDTCILAGQQQGWVTKNWAQYCSFSYIDLFETNLPRSELIQRIDSLPNSNILFGKAYQRQELIRCDNLYYSSNGTVVSLLDGSRGNNLQCGFSAVDATGTAPEHFAVNVIRNFNIHDVDRSKSYIQLEYKMMYFNHKIGCGKSEFMGCESPIESPVSGF